MKMTAQNKLHLPKLNAQTGQDEGGKRKAGLDVREKKKKRKKQQTTGWRVKYDVNEAPLDVWCPEVRL